MSETVRYGLIGCGMMGQEHLRNIALLPGATVTRIFEPNQGMADASLGLARGAQRAGSLAEVVQAADVDCLVITSPNFRHAEQMHEIAALRALPVLLEKPACSPLPAASSPSARHSTSGTLTASTQLAKMTMKGLLKPSSGSSGLSPRPA